MSQKEIPVKYSVPTVYTRAPYKSICKVVLNYSDDGPELYRHYIQTSLDEEHPYWEEMGHVLAGTFEPLFLDDTFIDKCFNILAGTENADCSDLEKIDYN